VRRLKIYRDRAKRLTVKVKEWEWQSWNNWKCPVVWCRNKLCLFSISFTISFYL